MALKKFHLIKGRYLFDDYESGLYFDLVPVHRPAGDDNVFNSLIDNTNETLKETKPSAQDWLCTLFLTSGQVAGLSAKYQVQFGAKSYLLLFQAAFYGDVLPKNPWFELGSGGMVCNPTGLEKNWIYYTNWNAGMLGHCFRRVEKSEVDAYVDPNSTTPPPDDGGGGITPPVNTIPSGEIIAHLKCPHCGKVIY